METPDELTFSAKQAAARLGLSPAMTRRYAAAYEEVTGEPIKRHPRDGRQYTRQQLETMFRAKTFVESNARLSVEQALTMASGKAEAVATALVTPEPGTLSGAQNEALVLELRSLVAALTPAADAEAVNAAVIAALEQVFLPEFRAMRASNERLEAQVAEAVEELWRKPAELPPAKVEDTGAASGGGEDGLLVRLAKRLERLWRP